MHLRLAGFGLFFITIGAWAQPAPQPFAIPQIKVRYTCEKTGRYWVSYGKSKNPDNRHYCWDGTHYSRADGGVPAFVLDYWAQRERERAQFRKDLDERTRDVQALAAAHGARTRPSENGFRSTTAPAVEASAKPKAEPIDRARFDVVSPGLERTTLVQALGEPHGQIANLGADGDEESLTWLLAGGGQARVRLKAGKVLNIKLP